MDWRELPFQGPMAVRIPILDDRPCGASWAFAATYQVEVRYAINEKKLIHLS